MLRDWIDPKLGLVLEGEKLVEIDSSNYLGSCISPGDRKSDEVFPRILNAPLELTNSRSIYGVHLPNKVNTMRQVV